MKFLTTLSIILLLTFSSLFSGIDVEEVKEKFALIHDSGNSGKEFLFTIPPIYEDESSGNNNSIEILVTSTLEGEVSLNVPGKGFSSTKTIIANRVISFSLTPNIAQPILHSGRKDKARPAIVYQNAAIKVNSNVPVIVYVVVKYKNNSDGFFAIPAKHFGKKYINSVYQEPALWESGWFNPFTAVVAAYDNTKINFTMGGGPEGNDEIPIQGGKMIKTGETHSQTMNKGDVWLLSINGQKQDLSGSLFEGSKPFAIVSGMHCANFPLGNRSCDYTVNMELPTKNWGKTHLVTPQMDRAFNGIVRIYASEPNTDIYRDGSYIGTLEKGGGGSINESYLELRVWPKFQANDERLVPKVATFTSTKPTAVVYYNTGSAEDKDYIENMFSDPFMAQIPPIESAIKSAIVYSPNPTGGSNPFTVNYLRITFPLVNDKIPDDLLFAELSTSGLKPTYRKISDSYGAGFNQFGIKYEGKTYASKVLTIGTQGVYSIKSDSSKFIVESFGSSNFETYGFPTAFSLIDYSKTDSLAAQITYTQECNGDILKDGGTVTDFPEDEATRSNMGDIFVLAKDNYNFDWRTGSSEFIPGEFRELKWWLTVIDKSKPASALLYFSDNAGNDTTILVTYVNTEIEATTTSTSLQNPKMKEVSYQDTIRNVSSSKSIYLTRVEFSDKNSGFSIDSFEPSNWDINMPILPNSEIYVNVNFSRDNIDNTDKYNDSLFIGIGVEKEGSIEECQYFPIANHQITADYPTYVFEGNSDFGELEGESKPIKLQNVIRNLSNKAPLYVSRLKFKYGDKGYTLGGFTPFSWDMTKPIDPNNNVYVDIIFNPKSVEQGEQDKEYIDSLGIGIAVMNSNNKLEEIEFSYKTIQKAILKAKDLTSVTPEQTLSEYMTVTESNIQLLPQALADGFTELSIFNIEGSKEMSTHIQAQNTISISSLKSGTYIITLKSNTRLLTRKINIVR